MNIEIELKTLHFREPFAIAYESVDTAKIIFLKIQDENGNTGYGSASPDTEVTGENIRDVYTVLQEKLTPDFFDRDIDDWYAYHEKIQNAFNGFPSAQAATEEAMLNMICQKHAISMRTLFGGYRTTCRIMITIGIKDADATAKEIHRRIAEGFQTIKIKCGLNLAEDLEKIETAQKIIPASGAIILDANQGYTMDEARELLMKLKGSNIALIEQPIASKNREGLKKLRDIKSIPIIADEAVVSVQDAIELITGEYVDGVNIKLMKCGGPINFTKIFHLAKQYKKTIMIGCMYESNVSLTTAANLALALPIDYVDLDSGHLDFTDDPAQGGMEINRGKISIKSPLSLMNK